MIHQSFVNFVRSGDHFTTGENMSKYPKWRIGVAVSNFHMVEIEAATVGEACESAINAVREDEEYYCTGKCVGVTSCFINDRESREFAHFVPEVYPQPQAG